MSALYDALLALSRRGAHRRRPASATHRARVRSRFCADELDVALDVRDGTVTAYGWDGHACVVCAAAAEALGDRLVGRPVDAVDAEHGSLLATLSGEGDGGGWFGFAAVRAHPARQACARLPFDAVRAALADPSRPIAEHPSASGSGSPGAYADDTAWAAIRAFRARGLRVALATLVHAEGSSPCPLGSRMIVASDGTFRGAVSGGCVESDVVQAALEVLAGAPPVVRTYQLANSQAGEVGLPCGGEVQVHVAEAPPATAVDGYAATSNGVRAVDLETGLCRLGVPDALAGVARRVVDADRPERVHLDGRSLWVEPLVDPPTLWIVGGTQIARALSALAPVVGLRPAVIDPRPAFGSADRFPGVALWSERPEHVLARHLDRRSAVVVVTHTEALDDPALTAALASPAWYVGALGSRKTQRARLARLRARGVPEAQLERLHGPAGLAIGGQGPGEIALSILAEVVATRRRPAFEARVAAVVLAAGASRRAGPENKLLRPIDEVPMVRRVVRTVLDAGVSRCVVVLGHDADRVRAALDGLPVAFVTNPDAAVGMGRSIAVGIGAVGIGADCTGAFVVLGDMPWVRADTLRTLVRAHVASTQHLAVVPVAGVGAERRPGNPVLWPRRAFAALEALDGDTGGKAILNQAPGAVLHVPVDDEGVLRDVDR